MPIPASKTQISLQGQAFAIKWGTRDTEFPHPGLKCGALHAQESRGAERPTNYTMRFPDGVNNGFFFDVRQ